MIDKGAFNYSPAYRMMKNDTRGMVFCIRLDDVSKSILVSKAVYYRRHDSLVNYSILPGGYDYVYVVYNFKNSNMFITKKIEDAVNYWDMNREFKSMYYFDSISPEYPVTAIYARSVSRFRSKEILGKIKVAVKAFNDDELN